MKKRVFHSAIIPLLFLVLLSCSSKVTKVTMTFGSFTFDCPNSMRWASAVFEVPDTYRDEQHLYFFDDNEEYVKNFVFAGGDQRVVFTMTMIWTEPEEGLTLADYNSNRRAHLLKEGIWTIISQIEETENSIILRAAPYKERIQDYGVQYTKWFKKDDWMGYVNLIIREEADAKYRNVIEGILKSVK